MNRRILGIVAAVVLAAAGTFVLVSYVQGAERRALAGERTVEVLVAGAEIAKGTAAQDLDGLVKLEQIPAKVQAQGSVTDLDDLDGKVAAVDLLPGEQIVAARFLEPAVLAQQEAVEVPEGLQQLTVSLQPERAVGGQIRPGETVGFFASFAPDVMPYSTSLTLHKVLVTNVQIASSSSAPPPASDEEPDSDRPRPAPAGQLLITLAVDPSSAEKIVFAAEHGTVWLSAQPASASEQGTTVKTPETIYQ